MLLGLQADTCSSDAVKGYREIRIANYNVYHNAGRIKKLGEVKGQC